MSGHNTFPSGTFGFNQSYYPSSYTSLLAQHTRSDGSIIPFEEYYRVKKLEDDSQLNSNMQLQIITKPVDVSLDTCLSTYDKYYNTYYPNYNKWMASLIVYQIQVDQWQGSLDYFASLDPNDLTDENKATILSYQTNLKNAIRPQSTIPTNVSYCTYCNISDSIIPTQSPLISDVIASRNACQKVISSASSYNTYERPTLATKAYIKFDFTFLLLVIVSVSLLILLMIFLIPSLVFSRRTYNR